MPPTGVLQARYALYVYDTTGTQVAVLTDWEAMSYTRKVNDPGAFSIDGRQPANVGLALDNLPTILVEDAIIRVRRSIPDAGIDWYDDGYYLIRDVAFERDQSGNLTFRARGVGPLDLVARRVVAYDAGTTQVEKRGASATVIGEYVEENVGPSATLANGRLGAGVTSGFSVTTAAGTFTTWEGGRHMQNVLAVIQGISVQTADVEFEVNTTVGGGSVAWEFATVDRIGTDRSATVIFSEPMGNLGAPRYSNAKTQAKNRAYVLGPGEKSDRIVIATNDLTLQVGSPWALAEMTREATQESTGASLSNVGATALEGAQPFLEFAFTPIETLATRYGRDYFLGDTVTAIAQDGTTLALRVIGVTIGVQGGDSGAESIGLAVTVLR